MTLTKIESVAKEALIKQLGPDKGNSQFRRYMLAKDHLAINVLEQIRATLPSHTDHSVRHIENVLINTGKILDKAIKKFSGLDLYCLILSILFHDAGNIYSRDEHRRNISSIYDFVFPGSHAHRQERDLILTAIAAHCGAGLDGSKDTLKDIDVGSSKSHLDGNPIQLQNIAAILRFADELAEGPHRTSLFMQQKGLCDPSSLIHHEYANITNVFIDRGNGRIALTYNIRIAVENSNIIGSDQQMKIEELLSYAYTRIIKLNQERQYAKYYCDYLSPFKKTSIYFNFDINGKPYDMGLSEVNITDIVVPGDDHKAFYDYDDSYDIKNIFRKINDCLQSG